MALMEDLNACLVALGGILTAGSSPLAGYDIMFAEMPTQPEKSDYPWVDILALDQEFYHDVTDSMDIRTLVVLRLYSKAQGSATTSSLLASQEELNDCREWVIDTVMDNAHNNGIWISLKVQRASRLYLEKDRRSASVADIECILHYRRRP